MVVALLFITFATALLSGVFGMGGGMILMGVLLALLPLSQAMVLHGSVQLVSNGSRAWLLRRHIRWRVLPGYLLGAALSVSLLGSLAIVVDAAVAMLILGALPLLLLLPKRHAASRLRVPSILQFRGALLCGVLISAAQLLVGVSGPLLDLFYLAAGEGDDGLNRFEVIATKAVTQALGHATKIVYFGALIGGESVQPVLYGVAIAATLAGTRTGTRLLARMQDRSFQRYSRVLILAIGGVFLVRGAMQL